MSEAEKSRKAQFHASTAFAIFILLPIALLLVYPTTGTGWLSQVLTALSFTGISALVAVLYLTVFTRRYRH